MSIRSPPGPDDPIEYYLDQLEDAGKPQATFALYELTLSYLREYLDKEGLEAGEMKEEKCTVFINHL